MDRIAAQLRKNILKASYDAGACHIGSALSCVEIIVSLYSVLTKKDAFIFAKASGVAALYSMLAYKKIIPYGRVAYYLKKYPLISREVPSIIWSGGSLGQGLSVAIGLALGDRKRKVYCLISDGELNSGNTWEALLFGAHHKLSNLIVLIDRNGLQACGATENILKIEPLKKKLETFNWRVMEIDGHNIGQITKSFKQKSDKPKIIIAKTIKGKGVSFCENDYRWHYRNLTPGLLKEALEDL